MPLSLTSRQSLTLVTEGKEGSSAVIRRSASGKNVLVSIVGSGNSTVKGDEEINIPVNTHGRSLGGIEENQRGQAVCTIRELVPIGYRSAVDLEEWLRQ